MLQPLHRSRTLPAFELFYDVPCSALVAIRPTYPILATVVDHADRHSRGSEEREHLLAGLFSGNRDARAGIEVRGHTSNDDVDSRVVRLIENQRPVGQFSKPYPLRNQSRPKCLPRLLVSKTRRVCRPLIYADSARLLFAAADTEPPPYQQKPDGGTNARIREEALQVRRKARKKLSIPRLPMLVPGAVNEPWSIDFVSNHACLQQSRRHQFQEMRSIRVWTSS